MNLISSESISIQNYYQGIPLPVGYTAAVAANSVAAMTDGCSAAVVADSVVAVSVTANFAYPAA